MAKLETFCNINMGQSPDSATYNTEGNGLPFFQGNADFGKIHPKTRIWCNAPTKVANAGDILVSVRAPIGALNIACEKCCIGRGLSALTVDNSVCDQKYLWYALLSKVDELNEKGTGSTFKAINKKALGETEIILPSLEEQRRIAAVLDKVTDLIDKRRQQLDKLDLLVKSRFVEMFGDPTLNPYGLEKKRFDTICENLDSQRKPITSSERIAGIYPYYGASGIVDYVEGYIFDEDILLISEDGANLLMRSTPIAFSVSGKVWVNNHAHVVRFDNLATQKYIEIYFSLIDISDQVTGSAQPKLNQAKLNAMEFMYPPIALQKQFASFVEQVDKTKLTIQQSLNELELLRKTLMQEYFL